MLVRAGGANSLCLHSSPQAPSGSNTASNTGALLYGAEYENTGALDRNENKDAACAVCMVKKAGHTYVQWGRSTSCTNGHEKLYSGLVMAERYTHVKSTFTCVDLLREAHARSSDDDDNGHLLYTTETKAGSMNTGSVTSGGHVDNREIGCTVCLAPRTVYNRWGHNSCPTATADLLYHGTLASGRHDHSGSQFPITCRIPQIPPSLFLFACVFVCVERGALVC